MAQVSQFYESDSASSRSRADLLARAPPTIYGRKHPEHGLLCHPCLTTALADQRRRWTAHEMTVMYSN